MSDTDLNKLKVVELRAELSTRDLDTKGNKATLVKRLREAINKEKGIVATEAPNEEADEGDGDTSQDETLDTTATDIPADVEVTTKPVSKTEPVKKDTPKKEAAKVESPKKEPQKVEPPKKEPAKVETPKKEAAKETPKKEVAKVETPKKEPVKVDTPKKEPAKAETPKKEPSKVEPPKKDSPKVASPKAVTPKKDVKAETPKKESPKVEIKKEPVAAESPKKEAPEVGSPSEPAKTDTPKKDVEEESAPVKEEPQEGKDVKSSAVESEDVAMEGDEGHNTEGTGDAKAENGVEASQDEVQPMEDESLPTGEDAEKPAQGEKRQRSGSRTPDRKKIRSHSKDKKRARSQSPYKVVEDEDDTFDDALITLDTYHSDLNLCIDKTRYAAAPLTNDGFGFMWAGARATYGFKEGKVAFEVKIIKHLEARRLPEDEPNPHVVRVGFSVAESTLQLGEDPLSYGYGGAGKASSNCEFKDYGSTFKEEDVITAFLNLDVDPIELSFAKNGEHLGIAYSVPKEELGDKALFPHVLSKNCSFEVNFGQKEEPFFKFPEEYGEFTFVHLVEQEKRIRAPKPPAKRDECEMVMMCGLPGAGKTTWAENYRSLHPEKNYNIIGTNSIIDKMKVMGLSRKRNYAGRWEVLIENSTRCLNRILEMGSRRRRNYILDQTNVYASAQRRKMRPFEGFKRRAVVLIPTDEEFKSRIAKREKEEGKDVPDKAVLEMKANFVLPEVGNIFSEVEYVELSEAEAATLIEQYVKEGREAFPPQQKRNFNKSDRRRPPSRFGPPRERGSFRGGRDDRRFSGPPMHGGYGGGGRSGRGGPMHGGRAQSPRGGHQQRGSFNRGPPSQTHGPPMFNRMDSGGSRGDGRRGGGRGGGGNGGSSFRGGMNKGGRGGDSYMHRDRRGMGDMGGGRGRRDNKFSGGMSGGHKSQHYGGGGGGGGGGSSSGGGGGYNQGFQGGYYNQQQGYGQQGGYTSPWKNQSGGNGSYQNFGQSHGYQAQQQQPSYSSQQSGNPQTSYGYGQQYYNQQWDQYNQQSQQYFNQPYNQQLYNPSQQYSDFSQKPTDRKSRHSRKF